MQANTRSFIAVLLSGLIVWLILGTSVFFRVPWWAFVMMLGFSYLVVDAGLQALHERITSKH